MIFDVITQTVHTDDWRLTCWRLLHTTYIQDVSWVESTSRPTLGWMMGTLNRTLEWVGSPSQMHATWVGEQVQFKTRQLHPTHHLNVRLKPPEIRSIDFYHPPDTRLNELSHSTTISHRTKYIRYINPTDTSSKINVLWGRRGEESLYANYKI